MGKRHKGHNWKARQQPILESKEKNVSLIKVQLDTKGTFDDANALLLPSSKKKIGKKKKILEPVKKLLSRKQRKHLEKVVADKKKKLGRAELLESLKNVQASNKELENLVSLSQIQTKGLKRTHQEMNLKKKVSENKLDVVRDEVTCKSKFRKKNVKVNKNELNAKNDKDFNVVGFSDSDTDSTTGNESSDHESENNIQNANIENAEQTPNISEKNKTIENEVLQTKEKQVQSIEKFVDSKPAVFVNVIRKPKIDEIRKKLPIIAEEQQIMEKISESPVVILAGETGSGKTTQVPQFLYEAGFASGGKKILVTEPRRVAAMSMSQRVAEELNLSTAIVSYQIRYEGNVTEETKIKFVTDGVLLKELENDLFLNQYSAVIIDEAHERSIFTDILIGILSRIVPLRHKKNNPLKLIIMSATLRVEDFTENKHLFKIEPPVIKVQSRQFPVTIHFNKHTPTEDILGEVYRKVCKIHKTLPEGGILVFVTGQNEVKYLVKRLQKAFPYSDKVNFDEVNENDLNFSIRKKSSKKKETLKKSCFNAGEIDLSNYNILPLDNENDVDIDDNLTTLNEEEDESFDENIIGNLGNHSPLYVLPLYSLLPMYKQAKVFKTPPKNARFCVIATNVAETSLTIPGIKYVVDTGLVKAKLYDKVTGVSTYDVRWTSKASANQRAGRAGRLGPGHCYRLFSSAVFNDQFREFGEPEILQRPVEDLVLQMKSLNIEKVINFPFPTPPDKIQLRVAENILLMLGALQIPNKNRLSFKELETKMYVSKITRLGQAMAAFPLSPRFGKMLALSHQSDLLPFTITLVSALSVPELLFESSNKSDGYNKSQIKQIRKHWAGSGESLLLGDAMVLLKAVGAAEYVGCSPGFCEEYALRHKGMIEVRKLRHQLTNQINVILPGANLSIDPQMNPPNSVQLKLLRQIILSGSPDKVAKKVDLEGLNPEDRRKMRFAYNCGEIEQPVFLQSSCVLKATLPEWVVFQEIYETNKLYMRGVTAIEPEWLSLYCESRCNFDKPLEIPAPRYDSETGFVKCHMNGTFGTAAWQLPVMEHNFPDNIDSFRHFAKFILEGDVFPILKKYRENLLSLPSTMLKTWAKLQPRTESLMKALLNFSCNCKSKVEKVWLKHPNYLCKEYLEWLPDSLHVEVSAAWPPVDET